MENQWDKPIAWITGAGGLIGSHLLAQAGQWGVSKKASEREESTEIEAVNFKGGTSAALELGRQECRPTVSWNVIGLTRATLDLTDRPRVAAMFREQRPQLVIHCAAMSRSPECQRNPAQARQLNVEVTRVLAGLAADIPLVFLSTDLVFDGRKGNYVEGDAVNPMSVYGETKAEAERIVLANPRHLVIRTSLNSGKSPTGDRGMDEQMILAWRADKSMKLFVDEFRCPIPAAATARAIWELVVANAMGLYHVAGAEKLSRWQIGELLVKRHPEFRGLISPGSLKEYEGAPRSPDTSLNCAKAQARLNFALPKFSDWLTRTPVL